MPQQKSPPVTVSNFKKISKTEKLFEKGVQGTVKKMKSIQWKISQDITSFLELFYPQRSAG